MIFDPLIGEPILDQLDKHAQDQLQLQQQLVAKTHHYWVKCPGCGHTVVRRELINKGCFRCGWQGTEEEIRLAIPKGPSQLAKPQGPPQVTTATTLSEIRSMTLYKVDCPQCQTQVVREQLIQNGCYLCEWKPKE